MRMLMVNYYDKDLEAFKNPIVVNCSDVNELKKDITKGVLKGYEPSVVAKFAHLELYHVGYYDDETSIIDGVVPEKLLDMDELIKQRMTIDASLKEVKEYGSGKKD